MIHDHHTPHRKMAISAWRAIIDRVDHPEPQPSFPELAAWSIVAVLIVGIVSVIVLSLGV